ncbi:alpha/beta fold hydrolase [Paracoccus onubensis]|uniref:Alpha/beta fold hydrolase n=1 Tax=Paracoccus onubensis TaxID=1675788 RepID=A0A418SRU6_9RHOB|nr:alpha/beta fold hydrolase [Paracoccus onubensis]RJE83700.1 alpha/beta fold hydrolase [Paracoccus onubensis]
MTEIFRRHWPGDTDRPALALHCMMASAGYWGPIAERLEGKVDLHGFDMPGHGRSGPWQPEANGPDYHTATTRIAASFINHPLDLIGHSMGATVALRIALAAPEAIRSLTLIEPVLFAAAPDEMVAVQPDGDLERLISEGRDEEATRQFLAAWGTQSYDVLPDDMKDRMRACVRLVAACTPDLMRDRANLLREGGLEAITAPVLLISGEQSPPSIHAIAETLASRLPDVGRAVVPDAGHMAPITHPDQVAGLIDVNLDRA